MFQFQAVNNPPNDQQAIQAVQAIQSQSIHGNTSKNGLSTGQFDARHGLASPIPGSDSKSLSCMPMTAQSFIYKNRCGSIRYHVDMGSTGTGGRVVNALNGTYWRMIKKKCEHRFCLKCLGKFWQFACSSGDRSQMEVNSLLT